MTRIQVMRERGPGFGMTGSAVVCCVHGMEKRRVTDLVYDLEREQAAECPCCANVYASDKGDPVLTCHDCRPRSAA